MLPSQAGRPHTRSHMYRRTRRRALPLLLAAAIVIGLSALTIKWIAGAGDDNGGAAGSGAELLAVNRPPAEKEPVGKAADSSAPRGERGARGARSDAPAASVPTKETSKSPVEPPVKPPAAKTQAGSAPPQTQDANSQAKEAAQSQPTPPTPPTIRMGENTPLPALPDRSGKPPSGSGAPASAPPAAPPAIVPPAPPTEPKPAAPKPLVTVTRADPNAGGNAATEAGRVSARLQTGLDLVAQNKPVEARRMLTSVLQTRGISPAEAERARTELARLNDRLIFGPEIAPGDPFASVYVIESNDALAKLPRKLGLDVDWRLLQRINQISAPERIQVGQRLKVIKGPFSAIIDKRAFRMDLYIGTGPERTYVRSFKVGLGEFDATPEGVFEVKPKSKLLDPEWVNPRSGERFAASDPNNPIGECWIGLIGISDNLRGLEGYGIHGTIDPESIGQMRSMGCVRLLADDVQLVYELLTEGVSRVEIHGEDYP